jgi:Xaa-Pro aminopeptidase
MVSWFSGPYGARAQRLTIASERVITDNWYITNEIEARYAGYVAQRMQPLYVGRAIPDELQQGFAVQNRALQACWEILKPGVTVQELREVSRRSGEGTGFTTPLILHGRGLGDDAPFLNDNGPHLRIDLDLGPIKENCVLQVKPSATRPGFDGCTWADSVVVTPTGARRLGKQPIEIMHIAD